MRHGGPEVLEVVEVPEVHAGPGQVRVRVCAAAVNPTDTLARNGTRAEVQKVDPPPYVPGMDIAGIVDEVGTDVSTGVKMGDAVMGMVVPKGAHGAYTHAGGSASLEQDRDTLTRADLGLPVVLLTRGWEPPTGELADFLDDARHSLPANTDIVLLPLAADDQTALVDGALLAQWQRFVDRHRPVRLCRP